MTRSESTYNYLRTIYQVEPINRVTFKSNQAYIVKISDGIRIYEANTASFLGHFTDQKSALSYFKSALN